MTTAPTLPGIVLGSSTQFGQGDRLLVIVKYHENKKTNIPVLLSRNVKADFDLYCFKRVNDSVTELSLQTELIELIKAKFSESFLFGRQSFSLHLF